MSSTEFEDPYIILNIESASTTTTADDETMVKLAYKAIVKRYHPDVTTNKDSSLEEKQLANDWFGKINWAYQTLMMEIENANYDSITIKEGGGGEEETDTNDDYATTSDGGGEENYDYAMNVPLNSYHYG